MCEHAGYTEYNMVDYNYYYFATTKTNNIITTTISNVNITAAATTLYVTYVFIIYMSTLTCIHSGYYIMRWSSGLLSSRGSYVSVKQVVNQFPSVHGQCTVQLNKLFHVISSHKTKY